MTSLEKRNIAGMSLRGGQKDRFYLCLIEYYPKSHRWFLKSLLPAKDEPESSGDLVIRKWIENYQLKQLVLDCPLTTPICNLCALECPGANQCPEISIKEVRRRIEKILEEDETRIKKNPKKYEYERNESDLFDLNRDVLSKFPHQHILSRSFKRRLKKGIIPYWNRGLDLWVWLNYYDQLLDLFNLTFDSFGNSSLMQFFRLSYLKRHFPKSLILFEGNIYLAMIELLRAQIISQKDIVSLTCHDQKIESRLNIITKIEKGLAIFIYDNDLEILVKSTHAFNSFLLALTGRQIHQNSTKDIPIWAQGTDTNFIVPSFQEKNT